MKKSLYEEIDRLIADARVTYGGIVKIQYDEVLDPVAKFPKAKLEAEALSLTLDEPVLLSMGGIEIFCMNGKSQPPIDRVQRKVLIGHDWHFTRVMACGGGNVHHNRQYLLDVNYGVDTRNYQGRIEDLRRRGGPQLKGDWAGAEEAPVPDYISDHTP